MSPLSRLCGLFSALCLSINIYHCTVCYNGGYEHNLKSYSQRGTVPLDDEQKGAINSCNITKMYNILLNKRMGSRSIGL